MAWKHMKRVDMQVSVLTAAIVIVSCCAVYAVNYRVTYGSMIDSLQQRVIGIHDYLETRLDNISFEGINSQEDEGETSYVRMKALLENIRNTTGVRYLYTAKQAQDGSFIYLIDGLPSDSEDFRHAGDPIEEEIIPDIRRAWQGMSVLPDVIKDTSWGYIFISYMPIFTEGQIIGVVGIEFDASREYKTFRMLKWITPVIIAVACILAAMIAQHMFRRISNPTFRDLSNTDLLTGNKNRNAFETDVNNFSRKAKEGRNSFIVADLDHLKMVNDTWGHQAGDRYIQGGCRLIQKHIEDGVLYRVGGDEFAVIFQHADEEKLRQMIKAVQEDKEEKPQMDGEPSPSLSMGCAVYDKHRDKNLNDTLKRADDAMYADKKDRRRSGGADCRQG